MGRTFAMDAPPRRVTLGTQFFAIIGSVLFQAAMGAATLGMIFFWLFAWDSELVTSIEFNGSLKETSGVVTETRATSARENSRRIFGNAFAYEVGGKTYRDESFSFSRMTTGQRVEVEYVVDRPTRARIKGHRGRKFSSVASVVVVIPLVALALGVWGLARGFRMRRLLRIGRIGHARLVSRKATGARVNKRPVHRYTFELLIPPETPATYRDAWRSWAQAHHFSHKTHDGARITDEAEEPVLYDPERPGNAVLVDAMHGGIEIGDDGRIQAPNGMLYLLVPLAFILFNGVMYALQ